MDISNSHKPSSFFVLRTALLPWEVYQAWGEGLCSGGADLEGLEEALALDRKTLRVRLQSEIQRPEHREALFLASPDLDTAIPHWLSARVPS